ncbi:MAG: hypothetical protein EOP84_31060, partial [Verrucomicrobiaceae bacterium]
MSEDTYDEKTPNLGLIAFLGVVAVLLGLFFLMRWNAPDHGREQARRDLAGLVMAAKAYQTEYGNLPLQQVARFEDETTQARLLRVLQAYDPEANPRGIWFFEAGSARKHGENGIVKYSGGLHPQSGALLD